MILLAKNVLAGDQVIFKSSQLDYSKGEEVKLLVKNISEEKTFGFFVTSVDHLVEGVWKRIRFDASCPCQARCKKGMAYLKPGIMRDIVWNQKDDQCALVSSGKYRMIIPFYKKENKSEQIKIISPTFQIKNK